MRTPRPGLRWTAARQHRRAAYAAYMASAAWTGRRRWWLAEHRRRTGRPAVCTVCGAREGLELHHHDYRRLGRETYPDLAPLCRACHRRVHDIYDACPPWRALGRAAASAVRKSVWRDSFRP